MRDYLNMLRIAEWITLIITLLPCMVNASHVEATVMSTLGLTRMCLSVTA